MTQFCTVHLFSIILFCLLLKGKNSFLYIFNFILLAVQLKDNNYFLYFILLYNMLHDIIYSVFEWWALIFIFWHLLKMKVLTFVFRNLLLNQKYKHCKMIICTSLIQEQLTRQDIISLSVPVTFQNNCGQILDFFFIVNRNMSEIFIGNSSDWSGFSWYLQSMLTMDLMAF